jgi:hypothetical protein
LARSLSVVLVGQVALLAGEAEVRDRDLEPVTRQCACGRRTDPVVAPGDEGDASLVRQP